MGIGLRDWLIQRFTAVYLAIYTVFLFVFCVRSPLTFEAWQGLFSHIFMHICTLFALVCIAFHAWIGLSTVLTDYVKCSVIRVFVQAAILFVLFGYGVWGIMILWGT
jgi:succinate dehydrogenase / fumarate reductase membrane anchor subunit